MAAILAAISPWKTRSRAVIVEETDITGGEAEEHEEVVCQDSSAAESTVNPPTDALEQDDNDQVLAN